MQRREFLRYGGAGLLAAAAPLMGRSREAHAVCAVGQSACSISLAINSTPVEMIDGKVFNMLGIRRLATSPGEISDVVPRVPGPVLRVIEGQTVTIQVRNDRPEAHSLVFTGVPALAGVPGTSARINIPARSTASLNFVAPVAGTYMYHDPSHPSQHLYRLLGLHGILVVHPLNGNALGSSGPLPSITPYSMDKLAVVDAGAAATISSVFNAFGTTNRFQGGKWVPSALAKEFDKQERIWLFSQVDPDFNTLIKPNGVFRLATDPVIKRSVPLPTTPGEVIAGWVPRYFTINGKSGFDLSENPSVVVANYIGQPTLLRIANAGLCHHATHIHGNHLLELAHSYVTDDGLSPPEAASRTGLPGEPIVHDNILERDVWPTWPMQVRDMLLPFEVPPDIPSWDKFVSGANQEPFPLRYVMHDHCEMGTTAAGGNYPQGAVTHWEILGPVQKKPV
jgi:hypothetical protein